MRVLIFIYINVSRNAPVYDMESPYIFMVKSLFVYTHGCIVAAAEQNRIKRKHKFVYKCEHSYKYEEIYLWICMNIYLKSFSFSNLQNLVKKFKISNKKKKLKC